MSDRCNDIDCRAVMGEGGGVCLIRFVARRHVLPAVIAYHLEALSLIPNVNKRSRSNGERESTV